MGIRIKNILSAELSDGSSIKINLDKVCAYKRSNMYYETDVYVCGHMFTIDMNVNDFNEKYLEWVND